MIGPRADSLGEGRPLPPKSNGSCFLSRGCSPSHTCVWVCVACASAGVLIYFGYGMWNSTLEITARENEVHASTYQRYDQGVDEGFCGFDDDFYPPASDVWGGGVDGAPPSAEEGQTGGVGRGAPSTGGDRTVAKHALAEEEDPMDF